MQNARAKVTLCHMLVNAVKRRQFTPQKIQSHTSNVSQNRPAYHETAIQILN